MVWNLVADIGGTNARFAALPVGHLHSEIDFHYSVQAHPSFAQLISRVKEDLAANGFRTPPSAVCIAVASPVDAECISFTNSHWSFSRNELAHWLGCAQLELINDFEAVAHGVTELTSDDYVQIGGGRAVPGRAVGVLGAGTGLGVAALIPLNRGYHILASEGGHADFAPASPLQIEVFNYLQAIHGHVSLERVLSGSGLFNIYSALCNLQTLPPALSSPAEVLSAALADSDAQARAALNMFCEAFGASAGNLALTLGARGGIYIGGGVIPRFIDFFKTSSFREKFESKGRFRSYLQPIPVFLITRSNPGLVGAAKYLQQHSG
jgi:glucokinase